jgi:hypothetical protein
MVMFEGESHRAPVVDMSSHGVGFLTKRTLRPGDVVQITFDIPYEVYAVPPGFKLKGRVVWTSPTAEQAGLRRVGCVFHGLKPDEQELITRIIRYGILRER